MSKHQQKFKDPYTLKRRKTFKDHNDRYKKVYHPYLPAILIFILSLAIFTTTSRSTEQVLSAATDISASRLLNETNEVRLENGASELKFNELLGEAAQNKADDMAKRDYWSHNTPEGKQPWQFVNDQGYKYSIASENLAFGFNSADEAINAWMKSDSHRKAMLDKSVYDVGFGISTSLNYQDKGAQTIIVAMYASPQVAGVANSTENLITQNEEKVTFAQSISGFNSNLTTFIIGGLAGGLVVFIFAKNIVLIRRKYIKGKNFILHHPAYDLTAFSVIVLLVVLSR
ncbi:MAG: CAP domain-containing protein, partial [Candidatus Saccharimonadales bacterium]